MTTLAEVQALERLADAAEDVISAFDESVESDAYVTAKSDAVAKRIAAIQGRAQYEIALTASAAMPVTAGAGMFLSNDQGSLRGSDGTSAVVPIDLTDISSDSLKDVYFNTHEGVQYTYTTGNTYTFGGGNDYAFCNSYGVDMTAECITDSSFKAWDGSFPYDIYHANLATKKPLSVGANDFVENFDNVPDAYKVVAAIPSGILSGLFFRDPDSDVDFSNNAVSKNIGHSYDYQLGDTYGVQLSQNTHEVTAVDMQHNFETVGVSENHSHVGLSANFDAHGADVTFAIKAVDIESNVTGLKVATDHTIFDFSYEHAQVKFEYSNSGKLFKTIDKVEFKVSDQDIKTITSERLNTVANKGIVLQVDADEKITDIPYKALGKDVPEGFGDLNPYIAWKRSLNTGTTAEKAFDNHIKGTDVNTERKNEKAKDVADFTRLDLDPVAASIASYDKGNKVLSELVLNPEKEIVEFSIRKDSKVYDQINNFTQHFGLKKGLFITSFYENKDTFGRMWFTHKKEDAANLPDSGLEAFTAGVEVQKSKNKSARIKLNSDKDSVLVESRVSPTEYARLGLSVGEDKTVKPQLEASTVILESHKADKDFASLIMDSGAGQVFLSVSQGSKVSYMKMEEELLYFRTPENGSELELKKDAATLTNKKTTIKAETSFTVDSKKTTIKSDNIALGNANFGKYFAKIPKETVTLGKGANLVKVAAAGVQIKGTTLKIQGQMATIAGNLIKLG